MPPYNFALLYYNLRLFIIRRLKAKRPPLKNQPISCYAFGIFGPRFAGLFSLPRILAAALIYKACF